MNRNKIITLTIFATQLLVGYAAIPVGYYNGVDQKTSDAVLEALFQKIKNHTVISYSNLENYYERTDWRADGTMWDMYSTCEFTMAEANVSQKAVCDGWNKEHSIPQSWFGKKSPMKSDLFHVYPTDARVNNFRSNLPYGECAGSNGTGITNNTGKHALGKVGTSTFPGYTGKVFEPDDEYKGDFARTYFYMVARYRDQALNVSFEGAKVFTKNGTTNLTDYAVKLFLKWHREDPVSQKEIDRNEAVFGIQKNRNPFIDYPYLAEYIWGEKKGQKVDFTMLMSSEDSEFVPGQSNGYIGVETGIDDVTFEPIQPRAVKVLRNGQLLIIKGDKVYNAQGVLINN